MPYVGRQLGQGTRSRFLYTATAGQTTFSGSDSQSNTLAYSDNNGLDCFQNGVLLKGGGADYTATSGTSVVLTTGASVSDVIEILVYDVFAIADHVKKSGDAMTGALTNIDVNGTELILDADGDTSITADTDDQIDFKTGGSDRLTIDNSGNILFGTTANTDPATNNVANAVRIAQSTGRISVSSDGTQALQLNRKTDDGDIAIFRKDGSIVGRLGTNGGQLYVGAGDVGLRFRYGSSDAVEPFSPSGQALRGNAIDLGHSSNKFDDIFAVNGTIQTSDQNEKQDIASATAKELNVAKKLSALFKTFRWKDAVAEKGEKARTHTGIVAQEVQSAFSEEGLDASNYGMFMSDTWWEKEIKVDAVEADEEKGIEAKDAYTYMDIKEEKTDGYTEKTRLGVRYPELFSFIFSSIEARLTALEGK